MKKLHKLAAAVAVAAGIALSPQSQAIELKTGGVGDALLFPVFAAGAGMYENYFTVSNSSNEWIQGHLRFRGSAWSAELLDFDVILSPGDVFVFRLADLDGDGEWEVDGSLDPKNFQYTGMVFNCGTVPYCIDANNLLEPKADDLVKAGIADASGIIGLQRKWGYVEFIGEAILNGMDHKIMDALTGSNPGVWAPYVTSNGNGKGTNTWKWSDAENGFRDCAANTPCDRGLSDVPNALSGTAFLVMPGQSSGLAYNGEALLDFRTMDFPHRIDNYARRNGTGGVANLGSPNNAVILHHENANNAVQGPSPLGDYTYTQNDSRRDECVIRFNNTWGPTLADGDDYLPTSIPVVGGFGQVPSVIPGLPAPANSIGNSSTISGNAPGNDAWDELRRFYPILGAGTLGVNYNGQPFNNSLTEVEMAIRSAQLSQRTVFNNGSGGNKLAPNGQIFTSFYFDASGTTSTRDIPLPLHSYYLAFFPTKFYHVETAGLNCATSDYINKAVEFMLKSPKPITIEVWNTDETPCVCTSSGSISPSPVSSSSACNKVLGYELNVFDIDWLKSAFTDGNCPGYKNGRTVVRLDTSTANPLETVNGANGYPGLMYDFEMSSQATTLANWRSMQKR
jgi:hypothetical protein